MRWSNGRGGKLKDLRYVTITAYDVVDKKNIKARGEAYG